MASKEKDRIKCSKKPKNYWAIYNGHSVDSSVHDVPRKTIPKSYSESFVQWNDISEKYDSYYWDNEDLKTNSNNIGRI